MNEVDIYTKQIFEILMRTMELFLKEIGEKVAFSFKSQFGSYSKIVLKFSSFLVIVFGILKKGF